jgi:DNA (cytosine-5)-methyltransferase 1
MRSVELFTGAGGLALGIEKAGFHHDTVVERNRSCCDTIRENQARGFKLLNGWKLFSGDVRDFDYAAVKGEINLLAGGPPCQPFSIGGKHRAHGDRRDMFPQVVKAVRELRPQSILVENVKGLTRKTFVNYFSYIVLQLSHPEITREDGEDWTEHRGRLERYHSKGSWSGLEYNVVPRLLNAANYGVPQRRERVFFVGFRSDLGVEWTFPEETHSLESLLIHQWVTGEYWDRHEVARKNRPQVADRFAVRVKELRRSAPLDLFGAAPWRTVRDALSGLPDPERENCSEFHNHRLNPGARSYVGHTGSPLDEPAKTLKAGDHGVPGGENMLLQPDGSLRYFTVRESARLQTFPDDYVLHGAWSEAMRQLGNAVPVTLAETVAVNVARKLRTLQAEPLLFAGAAS